MHRAPTKSTTSPLAPLLVGEGNRVRRQLLYCTIHPFSFQEGGGDEFFYHYLNQIILKRTLLRLIN
jgi:hypothetical protein